MVLNFKIYIDLPPGDIHPIAARKFTKKKNPSYEKFIKANTVHTAVVSRILGQKEAKVH